jgi:hypothetical protein
MKNLLFTGNPATGKTFLARAAAYYLCHEKLNIDSLKTKDIYMDLDKIEDFINSERCEFIQVHPSMTYEDIVYGIDISAVGTMTVDYVEKRIKRICDRAKNKEELYAIIFDDISRADAGALLGNLIYAMEFRNESIPLSDGATLCIPDNVVVILTECGNFHVGRLDYSLKRRMDYIEELKSDRNVLEKYYGTVNANAGRIIMDVFDSIKDFLTANASNGIPDVLDKYMPGHGMFMVERIGTAYLVLDKFKQKMKYQIFPFINNLSAMGVLHGNIKTYESALESRLNIGIAGLNHISGIRKIMINSGERVEPYSLEDTVRYYENVIIANRCSDYKGMLESVIDAIVMNGVFPYDIATDSLLFNTDVASVPSKSVPVAYASYLVKFNDAPSFYYETARKGTNKRNPHAYYSTRPGTVGRWAERMDVAAYEVSYTDGSPSDRYLPLNGLRLHSFTVNDVCRDNNPAEIYGAIYRLLMCYLKLYEINISLVKGDIKEYRDLDSLIRLEIKYLEALHDEHENLNAATQTEREKARIEYFGTRIMNLRTLWTQVGTRIRVNNEKFDSLVSGTTAFDIGAYEDIYNITDAVEKIIEIKGVVKMTDLKDYQQIMENIGVRQMIFQGPPGTSKTFESKKFVLKQLNPGSEILTRRFVSQEDISAALDAYKLNENDYANPSASQKLTTGGWDLVQFHPSYGYEDFIRGIEVKANGGLPSYNSVNRILGKIAEFAKIAENSNPDEPPKFYLIIDEINRANIATVFGELIYGLEYRNSKVSTPYEVEDRASTPVLRTKDIVLGKNLFIIGTMNTADKSIDSIDYAIRRRFLFVDSPADRDVIISCYQNISENNDENSIELLVFDAVQEIFDNESYFNNEYQKNDVRLGHTYFLRKRKEGYEEDFVERFVFQIIPILREYVKDGILDTIENLIEIEHTPSEIKDATDRGTRVHFIRDNIMLYAKEFGNMTKERRRIDNEYVATFIEDVRAKIGY